MSLLLSSMVIVFMILMGFLIASGIVLIGRAVKTKMDSFLFLGLFFLAMVFAFGSIVLRSIGFSIPHLFTTATVQVLVLLKIMFIFKTFYMSNNRFIVALLVSTMCLGTIGLVAAVAQHVIPESDTVPRLIRTLTSNIQYILGGSSQAGYSFRDWISLKEKKSLARIGKKFFLFGVSSILIVLFGLIDVSGTYLSIFTNFDYSITIVSELILMSIYCPLCFYIWVVMMGKDDRAWIGKISEISFDSAETHTGLDLPPSGRAIDVVDYFGVLLSEKLDKSPASCKGLLLVSIEGDLGVDGIYKLGLQQFKGVLNHGLRERMEKLDIKDVKGIISELLGEIEKKKSFFTMA